MQAEQNQTTVPTSPRNRRRLRSHLINHDVRLRLVLDDAIFALLAAFAAIGILYYLGNREIGDNLYSAHLSLKETRELLVRGARIAGGVTFVAVLLFGAWSLMDAHRIAGPMHRLHRLLNEIGDGNLTHEIRFRRRDEFPEIAAATDRLVDAYAERLAAIRRQADSLEAALDVPSIDAGRLAELRVQIGDLKAQLAPFRLPADGIAPEVDGRPLA